MGESLSKFFVPFTSLPALYDLPDVCTDGTAELNPTFAGVVQLVFLGLVYGFILFKASNLIAEGSELLLLFPKIAPLVGSVLLPILGAVPDGAIVLFAGLGSREKAKEQLSVGVGTLAGSTVMLLTVPWCLSIIAGKVAVTDNGECLYPEDAQSNANQANKKEIKSDKMGVEADGKVMSSGANMMLITSISYIVIQVAAFSFRGESEEDLIRNESKFALISLIFCGICFVYYLWYQVSLAPKSEKEETILSDLIQAKQVDALEHGLISLHGLIYNDLKSLKSRVTSEEASQPLLKSHNLSIDSNYNAISVYANNGKEMAGGILFLDTLLRKLFDKYDTNHSGSIELIEFFQLVELLRLQADTHMTHMRKVQQWFNELDIEQDGRLSYEEFKKFFLENLKLDVNGSETSSKESEEPDMSSAAERRKIIFESVWMMSLGTILVLLFSDPMVEVMDTLGKILNLSSFYVSFILAPLASNASEFIAAYLYAQKKTRQSITLSLSTLQGAAIMNNTFCLSIFLCLIYFRGLEWSFSAETVSILFVQFAMMYISKIKIQTVKVAYAVISLLPLSLLLVYFLQNVLGWS